jgi:cytochrome c-type biogenesis protein CcmH/NrfG
MIASTMGSREYRWTGYAVAATVVVAGCASPVERPGSSPDSSQKAVASLVESAHADTAAGRLANAAASMERAIRLAPRNARLWQELARLRLQQGEFAQAEHVALRSNSLTRGDASLRLENWNIIAQAREARGDTAGASSARELAKRIEY